MSLFEEGVDPLNALYSDIAQDRNLTESLNELREAVDKYSDGFTFWRDVAVDKLINYCMTQMGFWPHVASIIKQSSQFAFYHEKKRAS